MADLSQIPRDENGGVVGSFRLRHRDSGFSCGVAGVTFTDGLTEPLTGHDLVRLVVAMGADLDIEAAAPEPAGADPEPPPVPPGEAASAPVTAAAAEPDDALPTDREALFAIAAARGVQLDPRWSVRRMQQTLCSAR